MEQYDAVLGELVLHLAEELPVMAGADMLEHADRDDAVEAALQLAVVAQMEAHAIAKAGRRRVLLRELVLLDRERHAGGVHPGRAREVEGEPPPAAADVEQLLAGLEQE